MTKERKRDTIKKSVKSVTVLKVVDSSTCEMDSKSLTQRISWDMFLLVGLVFEKNVDDLS